MKRGRQRLWTGLAGTLALLLSSLSHAEDTSPLLSLYSSRHPELEQAAKEGIELFQRRRYTPARQWDCIKKLEPVAAEGHDPLIHLIIGFAAAERNLYAFARRHLEKSRVGIGRDYTDHCELAFAARYCLGRCLLGLGEDEEAERVLTEALTFARRQGHPGEPSLFWPKKSFCETLGKSLVARLLFDYQQEELALELFDELDPFVAKGEDYRQDGILSLDLARCHAALEHHEEALACYEETIRWPNWNACDRQMLHVDAGWEALAIPDYERALGHAKNALSVQPYCRSALVISARAKTGQEAYESASRDIWTAHHLDDDHPDVMSALQLLRESAGRDFAEIRGSCKPVRPKHKAAKPGVLYSVDFSDGATHGWRGEILEIDGERALRASVLKDNQYFGALAASPWMKDRPLFTVGEASRIKLRLRVDESAQVVVQGKNRTQSDNFNAKFEIAPGHWMEQELSFEQFQDNSYLGLTPLAGDAFNNLTLLAGSPGEDVGLLVSRIEILDDATAATAKAAVEDSDPWDRFPVFVWLDNEGPEKNEEFYDLLKSIGINGCTITGRSDSTFLTKCGMYFYVENTIRGEYLRYNNKAFMETMERYWKTGYDRRWLTRPKSFLDPSDKEAALSDLREIVVQHGPNRPLAYSLGDEISYGNRIYPTDLNVDARALRSYRQWLRNRHGTIEELNSTWETNCRSFDEVEVWDVEMARTRALRSGPDKYNFAPWCDHLEFNDELLSVELEALVDYMHDLDPWTPVGIGGAQAPAAFGGYDWSRLAPVFGWIEPYYNVGTRDVIHSFKRRRKLRAISILCPRPDQEGDCERNARNVVYYAGEGASGVVLWSSSTLFRKGEDLRLHDGYVGKDLRALLPEGNKWPSGLERASDGVYFYLTQRNLRAQWILEAINDRKWWRRFGYYSREGSKRVCRRQRLYEVLERAGYCPLYANEAMLSGQVEWPGEAPKVLILSDATSLSSTETERLSEFCKRGGTLVVQGDVPGTLDEFLRSQPSRILVALAGIRGLRGPTADITTELSKRSAAFHRAGDEFVAQIGVNGGKLLWCSSVRDPVDRTRPSDPLAEKLAAWLNEVAAARHRLVDPKDIQWNARLFRYRQASSGRIFIAAVPIPEHFVHSAHRIESMVAEVLVDDVRWGKEPKKVPLHLPCFVEMGSVW